VTVRHNLFRRNRAIDGAAAWIATNGLRLATTSDEAYSFTGNTFLLNEAVTGGGGVWFQSDYTVTRTKYVFDSNIFESNIALPVSIN